MLEPSFVTANWQTKLYTLLNLSQEFSRNFILRIAFNSTKRCSNCNIVSLTQFTSVPQHCSGQFRIHVKRDRKSPWENKAAQWTRVRSDILSNIFDQLVPWLGSGSEPLFPIVSIRSYVGLVGAMLCRERVASRCLAAALSSVRLARAARPRGDATASPTPPRDLPIPSNVAHRI